MGRSTEGLTGFITDSYIAGLAGKLPPYLS